MTPPSMWRGSRADGARRVRFTGSAAVPHASWPRAAPAGSASPARLRPRSRQRLGAVTPAFSSASSPSARIDADGVAGADLALQQREREPVDELLLDHAAQRPGTVGRVIAHVAEQLARVVGERDLDPALGEPLEHAGDLQLDDLGDLLAGQRVEAHDVVEAVDELGFEVLRAARAACIRGASPCSCARRTEGCSRS